MENELCGCGKPARYMVGKPEVLSCNKHFRCLTYDELIEKRRIAETEVRRLREALEHYADEDNWQEDNTTELTTYVVWKHFPDEGNELYSGPDIAKAALKETDNGND